MRNLLVIFAFAAAFATLAQAVPMTLYYAVTGTGPFTYNFTLVLDNNDSSFNAANGQGWDWFIFGDANGTASPLTSYSQTTPFPVGPWTSLTSSGGGHNGPTFNPVTNAYWFPTAVGQSLSWSGTSTANLAQGALLWSTLINTGTGVVGGNFAVGQKITNTTNTVATAGSAQSLPPTDTGSGVGRNIGTFTITNSTAGALTLNNIAIQASGTGNDKDAFSEVGLFEDTNANSTYDSGTDVRYGSAATAYPTDDGTLTFTASKSLAAAQVVRYFVVVKLNGATLAQNGHTFNTRVSSLNVTGSAQAGLPSTLMNGISVVAPLITVAAVAASAQSVPATDTGTGGNGIRAATFTLSNNTVAGGSLNSITVTASGSGNDSNAYSQVALYEDTNSSGAFEFGTDTLYGAAVTAFPTNDGALTFTQTQAFAASQVRRYFVVVKLNGSTLASNAETFNFQVTGVVVSGAGASTTGVPTSVMTGLVIIAPVLTVSATAGTSTNVYADDTGTGGNGRSVGTFTVTNNAIGSTSLNSITLTASGTGNDSNAYSEVGIFEDTNASTVYDAGDTRYGTAATAFPINDGNLTFTATKSFAASQSVRYFVVVKLNGATLANPTETFNTRVNAITVTAGSGTAGTPSTVMNGLTILAPGYTITDNSSATQANAYLGGSGYVIQQFTIAYASGPANTLTSITVQSSGNGNDQTDYASVALYRDANANATYDVGVDTLVNSFAAFPTNDGSQNFTLSGTESQFTAGTTRQYFIVVAYNLAGANNTAFATQLQAASGQTSGTTITGLPAPTAGPTAGLLLLANNLLVTLNGPGTATTVNNNDQGPGGNGRVIFDVTLQTINAAWTVTDLTFTGKGAGTNHQTAYNYLALFLDANTNGTFDGADTLATATAGVSFGAGNNYTATLSNPTLPATTSQRYFLVGKLAGTATTGQQLNAQLTAATTTPPSGGSIVTIPTADSVALIIDTAVLTAANGTAAPAGAMREGGVAFGHTLGFFSFTSTNNPATLNAITLTTGGSGTWNTDVSALEVYVDDGNGTYDGTPTDTLVFTGAGATPTITCTFTSAVNIATNQTKSLWVRLNFAAGAGASVPETYNASIANAADISVTGATALLGAPAPTTNDVSVVLFFVTTFAPAFDVQTGGAAITITGSGFLSPLTVTINGAVCGGTPVISGGGTQVTGLTVPPGSGQNRPIVVNNGALGPKTLTQTFDYAGGSTLGGSGGGGGGGGGCSTQESDAAWMAAVGLLSLAALVGLRRRVAR